MSTYSRLLIPAVLIAAVAVAACGGGSSKTVNIPGGGAVSVSGKLPDNFPKDYPVYGGAKVQGSYSGTSQGITGTVVTWETGDSLDKVKSFYADAFSKGPWKSDSNGEVNASAYWSGSSSDGKQSFYSLASTASGKTSIIATLGDKPAEEKTSAAGGSGASQTSTSGSSSSSNKTATAGAGSSSSGSGEKSATASPLPPEVTLANDFPKDRVPLPSGARITSSSSFGSGGGKTYIIEFYTKDAPDKAVAYFSGEMPKHGWTEAFTSNSNGEYFVTFTAGDTNASANDGLNVNASPSDSAGYSVVSLAISLTATTS